MPTEFDKTVSIIIPVYNTAQYLDECLESVTKQTYRDIEILLINDGSKDNSLEICNKWAKLDERIKVFDNENHGVSYTRNFGIGKSCGKYIAFVDSDDVISCDYITKMLEILEDTKADMSIISYCTFYDVNNPLFSNTHLNVVKTNDFENCFFVNTSGVICSKLYLRNIIIDNSIKFDEKIAVSEDLLFNLNYVGFCNTIVINNSKLYGYRQRSDSAAHNTVSLRWFSCLKAYKYLFENYKGNSVYPHIVFYYLKNLYEAKYTMKKHGISKDDIDFDVLNNLKIAEKKKSIVPFKKRIKLFVCKHFFGAVLKRRG